MLPHNDAGPTTELPAPTMRRRENSAARASALPRWAFSLPVAFAAGLVLRLLLIGSKSLWLDEAYGLWTAQAPFSDWLLGVADFAHPPLYYFGFLRFWMRLGQSETVLRLSSALFGVAAILLAYLLARSLATRGVSLSLAWLVALSPLLVWYSQELRCYSLLVCLGLLSSLAFVRLLAKPHMLWWLLYLVATVAALYTHYYALLLLPVQLALLMCLLAQGRLRRTGLVAALAAWPIIAAAFWPWLNTPAAINFVAFARGSVAGLVDRIAARAGVAPSGIVLLASVAGLAGLVLLLGAWLFVTRRGLWPALFRSQAVRAALVVAFVTLLALSVIPRGYSVKQAAVIGIPFVCLVVAWFWPLDRRPSKTLAVLLVLSAAASLINVVAIPKEQWREAARYLQAAYRPGDVIWIAPSYDNFPFDYYNRGQMPVREIDAVGQAQLPAQITASTRLWLVYDEPPSGAQPIVGVLDRLLSARFRRAGQWNGYRVRTVLFLPQ